MKYAWAIAYILRVTVLVAISISGLALAASDAPKMKTMEEYQAISDRAMAAAREHAQKEKSRQASAPVTAPALQPDRLRAAPRVDPAEIANRYSDFQQMVLPPAEDLLIFVSSSQSMETLKRLGLQAKRAGAVLVFRGMNGSLRKKGDFKRWLQYLEPLVQTGADVQINPNAFREHNVVSVPTFVISRRTEGCTVGQCQVDSSMLVGDVSLDYALEYWTTQHGPWADIARSRLNRMGGGGR